MVSIAVQLALNTWNGYFLQRFCRYLLCVQVIKKAFEKKSVNVCLENVWLCNLVWWFCLQCNFGFSVPALFDYIFWFDENPILRCFVHDIIFLCFNIFVMYACFNVVCLFCFHLQMFECNVKDFLQSWKGKSIRKFDWHVFPNLYLRGVH